MIGCQYIGIVKDLIKIKNGESNNKMYKIFNDKYGYWFIGDYHELEVYVDYEISDISLNINKVDEFVLYITSELYSEILSEKREQKINEILK